MSFRDHPLCGPTEGWPAQFWGPEQLDHEAWVEFADRLDTDDEIDLIIDALGDPVDILDVGGGTGTISRAVAARFGHVVVVEPNADQASAIEAAPGSTIAVLPGRAESLPVDTGVYDAVLATWVLQYTSDPAASVAEMARACKNFPGCCVVLLQAAPGNQIVELYNVEARVAGAAPAHHGFLLALAGDALADEGFDVTLTRCPATLATPENNPARVASLLQRLHFAGHDKAAQIRAATEPLIANMLHVAPGSLNDDGVILRAARP